MARPLGVGRKGNGGRSLLRDSSGTRDCLATLPPDSFPFQARALAAHTSLVAVLRAVALAFRTGVQDSARVLLCEDVPDHRVVSFRACWPPRCPRRAEGKQSIQLPAGGLPEATPVFHGAPAALQLLFFLELKQRLEPSGSLPCTNHLAHWIRSFRCARCGRVLPRLPSNS